MHQQYPAALDVLKEYLDYAVSKGNERKDVEEIEGNIGRYRKAALQHAGAFPRKVNGSSARKDCRQVVGKAVLQANAELVQLHRHDADERAGKEALEDIDRRGLDVRPAVLVFYRHIEYGDHHTGDKQRPTEQRKKLNGRLNPVEVKDIRAHAAHHSKKVRYCVVDGFIKPFQHGVPDYIGYLLSEKAEHAADGVPDPAYDIAKPVKHIVFTSVSCERQPADVSAELPLSSAVLLFLQDRPDIQRRRQGKDQTGEQDARRGELKLPVLAILEIACPYLHEKQDGEDHIHHGEHHVVDHGLHLRFSRVPCAFNGGRHICGESGYGGGRNQEHYHRRTRENAKRFLFHKRFPPNTLSISLSRTVRVFTLRFLQNCSSAAIPSVTVLPNTHISSQNHKRDSPAAMPISRSFGMLSSRHSA